MAHEPSLYGSKWQRARVQYLRDHPLCVDHARRGISVAATVVDHITPHRGDLKLFWNRKNWQALCEHCHNSHKQRLERSGRELGCDVNGLPLDGAHHWNGNNPPGASKV